MHIAFCDFLYQKNICRVFVLYKIQNIEIPVQRRLSVWVLNHKDSPQAELNEA